MPFFNPFTPFGGRTFLDGAAIAFRGATATRATGGFMARLDAGSIFVPPVGYGYGDASVGLSFDAGFAPAGSIGLTVSVSGVVSSAGAPWQCSATPKRALPCGSRCGSSHPIESGCCGAHRPRHRPSTC
jgi:hypothetical protein